MKKLVGTRRISAQAPELLQDESSLSGGNCQWAAWPENTLQCSECLFECYQDRIPVTFSGARTGIAGGAVPMGGAVVSTNGLTGIRLLDTAEGLLVGAGESIDSVAAFCRLNTPGFFYPPNPTERAASIGGTIATDASGSWSYRYGSTRRWVAGLTVALHSGKKLTIQRGEHLFHNGRLNHPLLGRLVLPELKRPQPAKNAAGLFIAPDMDLIDLFIGSEGTLGLITEAELILAPEPAHLLTTAVFCQEEQFWGIRNDLLHTALPVREIEAMIPPCLEFLENNTSFKTGFTGRWVLMTSIEAETMDDVDLALEALSLMLDERGVSPDSTWGGLEQAETQRMADFRHLLPETVNRKIADISLSHPFVHKMSGDAAVPPDRLRDYAEAITQMLDSSGLPYLIFGHCGQGHLHVNLIPASHEEMEKANEILELTAGLAVEMEGTVTAEHGVGKLKKGLLSLMYDPVEMEAISLLTEKIRAV